MPPSSPAGSAGQGAWMQQEEWPPKPNPVARALRWMFFVCAFIATPLSFLVMANVSLDHPHSNTPAVMLAVLAVLFIVSLVAAIVGTDPPPTDRRHRRRARLLVLS